MAKVIITGVNGYLALRLVQQLLEKGYYVVGTVRNKEKGDVTKSYFPDNFEYEVVPNITQPGAFDEVLKKHNDAEGFFHMAASSDLRVTDFDEDFIKPSVEGTKSLLASISKLGSNIKRLVYTSSIAAMNGYSDTEDLLFSENSFNPIKREDVKDVTDAYALSKVKTEAEVLEFMKLHSSPTVNIVCPSFVFGPLISDNEVKPVMNSSVECVHAMLKLKKDDPIPPMSGGFVDVRDTMRLHVFALETNLSGLRLLPFKEKFNGQLLLDIIHQKFPQLDHLPYGNPGTGSALTKHSSRFDNSETRKYWQPEIGLKQSVEETVAQILAKNL